MGEHKSDTQIWRHLRPTKFEGFLIPSDAHMPSMLANWFIEMKSDEQAYFFNVVGKKSSEWEAMPQMQWRYMQDELSRDGKDVLRDMYQHTRDDGEDEKDERIRDAAHDLFAALEAYDLMADAPKAIEDQAQAALAKARGEGQ